MSKEVGGKSNMDNVYRYTPRHIFKGMSKDNEITYINEGYYNSALNAVFETTQGDLQDISNELGNELCGGILQGYPDSFSVIGSVTTDLNITYLFLTDDETSYIMKYDSTCCSLSTIIKSTCLNFNKCNPIKSVEFVNKSDCREYIYWIDGLNDLRKISLKNLENYTQYKIDPFTNELTTERYTVEEANENDLWDCSLFSSNPCYDKPIISDVVISEGGKLRQGTYQFAIRLLDFELNPTVFEVITRNIPVTSESTSNYFTIEGGFTSQNNSLNGKYISSKSISLLIENLDRRYKYYEIAVIGYTQNLGVVSDTYLLPKKLIEGDTDTFEFTGLEDETIISIDEILIKDNDIGIPQAMALFNNRLVLASNTKKENSSYKWFQRASNKILTNYVVANIPKEELDTHTKRERYYFDYTSFMRDEVYALGCYIKFKCKPDSPVFHIPGINKDNQSFINTALPIQVNNPYYNVNRTVLRLNYTLLNPSDNTTTTQVKVNYTDENNIVRSKIYTLFKNPLLVGNQIVEVDFNYISHLYTIKSIEVINDNVTANNIFLTVFTSALTNTEHHSEAINLDRPLLDGGMDSALTLNTDGNAFNQCVTKFECKTLPDILVSDGTCDDLDIDIEHIWYLTATSGSTGGQGFETHIANVTTGVSYDSIQLTLYKRGLNTILTTSNNINLYETITFNTLYPFTTQVDLEIKVTIGNCIYIKKVELETPEYDIYNTYTSFNPFEEQLNISIIGSSLVPQEVGLGNCEYWQVYNTADKNANLESGLSSYIDANCKFDIVSTGRMSYYEVDCKYSDIKCDDDLPLFDTDYFGNTLQNQNIRHHKMPDATLEPIVVASDHHCPTFKDILPMGIIFDCSQFWSFLEANLSEEEFNEIDSIHFVKNKRLDNQKTIEDKGLLSSTRNTCLTGCEYCDGDADETGYPYDTLGRYLGTHQNDYFFNMRDYQINPNSQDCIGDGIVGDGILLINFQDAFNTNYCSNALPQEINGTQLYSKDSVLNSSVLEFHSPKVKVKNDKLNECYYKLENLYKGDIISVQSSIFDMDTDDFDSFDAYQNAAYADYNTQIPLNPSIYNNNQLTNFQIVSPSIYVDFDTNYSKPAHFGNFGSVPPVIANKQQRQKVFLSAVKDKLHNYNETTPSTTGFPFVSTGNSTEYVYYAALKNCNKPFCDLNAIEYEKISLRGLKPNENHIIEFRGDCFITLMNFYKTTNMIQKLNKMELGGDGGSIFFDGLGNTLFTDDLTDSQRGFKRCGCCLIAEDCSNVKLGWFCGIKAYVESEINFELRHKGIGKYEKITYQDLDDCTSFWYSLQKYFSSSQEECVRYREQYFAYNPDYNIHNVETLFSANYLNICGCNTGSKINQIIYSEPSNFNNLQDNLLNFKPANFLDLTSNEGNVSKLIVFKNALYAFTENYLLRLFANERQLKTDGENIITGTGDFMTQQPVRLNFSDYPLTGCMDIQTINKNEAGMFWLDYKSRRIFLLQEGLTDLTNLQMYNWFRENIPLNLEEDLKKYLGCQEWLCRNTITNKGIGFLSVYDPRHRRYILSKRDFKLTNFTKSLLTIQEDFPEFPVFPRIDFLEDTQEFILYPSEGVVPQIIPFNNSDYFENKSWTVSYQSISNSWISFHSWMPNYGFNDSNYFYTTLETELLPTGNPNFLSGIWKHNEGEYQTYYNRKYPHFIDFTFSTPQIESTWDTLVYTGSVTSSLFENLKYIETETYDNFWAATHKQITGELKLNMLNGLQHSQIIDYNPTLAFVKLANNEYRINRIRDLVIDYNQPLFTNNWTDIQSFFNIDGYQGYMDKVVNPASFSYNKSLYEQSRLRNKWCNYRLSTLSPNNYKYSLTLTFGLERNNAR